MTIMQAIDTIDELKPNGYTMEEKVRWLSKLDGAIKREIIDTHEGGEKVVFDGYTTATPTETELLVEAPYDELYLHWLESRIDYYNGEYGRYNNTVSTYNAAYSAFERFYNRAHKPLGQRFKYF